jgi:hypothetical protein
MINARVSRSTVPRPESTSDRTPIVWVGGPTDHRYPSRSVSDRDPLRETEQYAKKRDAMRRAVEHSPRIVRRKQKAEAGGASGEAGTLKGLDARTDGPRPEPPFPPEPPIPPEPPMPPKPPEPGPIPIDGLGSRKRPTPRLRGFRSSRLASAGSSSEADRRHIPAPPWG